jgi:hypothetical protein
MLVDERGGEVMGTRILTHACGPVAVLITCFLIHHNDPHRMITRPTTGMVSLPCDLPTLVLHAWKAGESLIKSSDRYRILACTGMEMGAVNV